jgi:hypothetical protein
MPKNSYSIKENLAKIEEIKQINNEITYIPKYQFTVLLNPQINPSYEKVREQLNH